MLFGFLNASILKASDQFSIYYSKVVFKITCVSEKNSVGFMINENIAIAFVQIVNDRKAAQF